MGVRVPSKGFQKQTPIECCVRPPVPQVMKVCFILVWGHRCETCTPVFYRGEKLKITPVLFAPLPRHSLEKMMQKKTCAPPFYRGCLDGGTCTPRIYNYKMGGHRCRPEFTGGCLISLIFYHYIIYISIFFILNQFTLNLFHREDCSVFVFFMHLISLRLAFPYKTDKPKLGSSSLSSSSSSSIINHQSSIISSRLPPLLFAYA